MLMVMVYHGFRNVVAEGGLGVDRVRYYILTLFYPVRGEGGLLMSVQIFDLAILLIVLLTLINVVLFVKEKE
jgi:hypothetical protein